MFTIILVLVISQERDTILTFCIVAYLHSSDLIEHQQNSVHFSLFYEIMQMLLVYVDFEQSHFTKWITASGAGNKDVITGLNLQSTKFQL